MNSCYLNPILLTSFFFRYQLTGTDFFDMKNNKIFTKKSLNREENPEIQVNIACHVKMGSLFSHYETKVFNITILDVNDNIIKDQDSHKVTTLKLDTPNFEKASVVVGIECKLFYDKSFLKIKAVPRV